MAKTVGAAAMRSKVLAAGAELACAVAKAGTTRQMAVMEHWALMERVMSACPAGITCWQSIQALTQGTRDKCVFLFCISFLNAAMKRMHCSEWARSVK